MDLEGRKGSPDGVSGTCGVLDLHHLTCEDAEGEFQLLSSTCQLGNCCWYACRVSKDKDIHGLRAHISDGAQGHETSKDVEDEDCPPDLEWLQELSEFVFLPFPFNWRQFNINVYVFVNSCQFIVDITVMYVKQQKIRQPDIYNVLCIIHLIAVRLLQRRRSI